MLFKDADGKVFMEFAAKEIPVQRYEITREKLVTRIQATKVILERAGADLADAQKVLAEFDALG